MKAALRRRLALPLGAVAAAIALAGLWWLLAPEPRTLYVNGPILTMDGGNTIAEALFVEGDRIVEVGSRADLEHWADEGARVVDLAGQALVPGFIEAHGHFPGIGMFAVFVDLRSAPVGRVATLDDLFSRLRDETKTTPAGDWIVGAGYDDTLLAESRHPTRADLDAVSTEHPILIWHVSFHLAVANSRALELAGVTASTPDPEGGRFRRDPTTGEPDGVLEENAAEILRETMPQIGLLDGIAMAREAARIYAGQGVTTVQNGLADKTFIKGLTGLSRLGVLPLRLILWPDEPTTEELIAGTFEFEPYDELWSHLGATKLLADGSIQGYTAYLTEPYHVAPGEDAAFRGYPRIERERLMEQVDRYHSRGLQVAVHGNGDASIDDILDAFEAAQKRTPRPDPRHVIIHCQMARPDQLDRMRDLGVIPSFFVLHTYYWGDRHRDIFLGPKRAARISPTASATARGLLYTLHADAPVVPMEPLRIVWSAVNRRSVSGAVIGAEESIDPVAALRAVTIDAAYQHFEEDVKGSLEPGKLADMVILSSSPLDDPEHIDTIRVVETIVGGRTVYRAEKAG